mmetsp:Transcript_21411/g.40004  ORF Transcript_21411/g.40004 Transcript_21411/m.40004 type:complete len:126 (-) Transcript_21411:963-1340(-)
MVSSIGQAFLPLLAMTNFDAERYHSNMLGDHSDNTFEPFIESSKETTSHVQMTLNYIGFQASPFMPVKNTIASIPSPDKKSAEYVAMSRDYPNEKYYELNDSGPIFSLRHQNVAIYKLSFLFTPL